MAQNSTASLEPTNPHSGEQQTPRKLQAYDPVWYTWSRLFGLLSGKPKGDQYYDQGHQYLQGRSVEKFDSQCARCEKWRDWLLKYSPSVRFMADNIAKVGGEEDASKYINCTFCERVDPRFRRSAHASTSKGIIMCQNALQSRSQMEDVMVHEMVHVYDMLRFNADHNILRHSACMEIRAAMLSGECRWSREALDRGNWSFVSHFQDCVRARAAMSVSKRTDINNARKVINEVWGSCFADTRPFDEIYR